MGKLKSKIFLLSVIFLVGCHVPSRVAIDGAGGRNAYNIAVQLTNMEELLLNVVRLRYCDTPYFLEVSNITTQFTYKASTSPTWPIPGFNKDNPFTLGGEWTWQNQPTISYSPLQGQQFAVQLMQPIDLQSIQQMVYTGWDVDRVFRLVIQSFDQLRNTPLTGPVFTETMEYKRFFEATRWMREFQKRGSLQVGLKVGKGKSDDKSDQAQVLQIAFPKDSPEADRLAQLLGGVEAKKGLYVLNMLQGFNDNGGIGVMPRSLLSCMYYLCQSVDVPEPHLKKGLAPMPELSKEEMKIWQRVVTDLMQIKTSNRKPKEAYVAVRYRGYWFYIDDSDIKSKRTFLLLHQLYQLQASETKSKGPLLTLPIGV